MEVGFTLRAKSSAREGQIHNGGGGTSASASASAGAAAAAVSLLVRRLRVVPARRRRKFKLRNVVRNHGRQCPGFSILLQHTLDVSNGCELWRHEVVGLRACKCKPQTIVVCSGYLRRVIAQTEAAVGHDARTQTRTCASTSTSISTSVIGIVARSHTFVADA